MKKNIQRYFIVCVCLLGIIIMSCYINHPKDFVWSKALSFLEHTFTTQNDVFNVNEVFPDGVWTMNSNNRLGNQMGEYAILYALAKLHGRPAAIVPGMVHMLCPLFNLTLPHLNEIQEKQITWQKYWLTDWMLEKHKQIKGKYVQFTGCPNSWTFYHHIKDEIRREFTFHPPIKKEVNEHLESLRGSRTNVTYVGVHVRRGDYAIVMARERQGVVADKGYLEKAMTYFRNKYQEPIFVVASNDMKWCKQNIDASSGDVYFSGDGNEHAPKRDFALLAHCNHTIMTMGTFGHWIAYLAGGETIYLTNFTLPDSPYLKLFRYEASFLPEWIGISADLSPLLPRN
ncbi:galactoside alpha-(1,2)-fucosyltransferase 2-like [Ambystoma mexicanum]|uniref:galactoside alpha-(1,2)-fucosyltransferase 2-like n=1 Tax=Ambystoma mexicanum TaxID=8296 RepID=UPI0037E8C4C8